MRRVPRFAVNAGELWSQVGDRAIAASRSARTPREVGSDADLGAGTTAEVGVS